jgi:hypothetical protein
VFSVLSGSGDVVDTPCTALIISRSARQARLRVSCPAVYDAAYTVRLLLILPSIPKHLLYYGARLVASISMFVLLHLHAAVACEKTHGSLPGFTVVASLDFKPSDHSFSVAQPGYLVSIYVAMDLGLGGLRMVSQHAAHPHL